MKGNLQSCRVFSAIDVRASTYSSETGEHVPFTEVERSPAAGLWIIGQSKPRLASALGVSDTGEILRVVLKYPVEDLVMETETLTVALKQDLDPAGDSATLSATNGAHLRAAWLSGSIVRFVGRSRDTGRTIEDVILPPDQKDIQACAAFEAGVLLEDRAGIDLPEVLSVSRTLPDGLASVDGSDMHWQRLVFDPVDTHLAHHGHISVLSGARLPGSPSKSELIGCRMTDLGGEIERYRLTRVNGFVSHSSEVWVTRDAQGQVRQVYIPGVFEALRKLDTNIWTADVSIAAFANNPFEAPVNKGCLGSQRFPMASPADFLSEPLDGLLAAFSGSDPLVPAPVFGNVGSATTFPGAMAGLSSVSGGSGTRGSSRILFDDTWRRGDQHPLAVPPLGPNAAELAPVPLPPGVLLFVSGLGFFGFLRRKTRLRQAN